MESEIIKLHKVLYFIAGIACAAYCMYWVNAYRQIDPAIGIRGAYLFERCIAVTAIVSLLFILTALLLQLKKRISVYSLALAFLFSSLYICLRGYWYVFELLNLGKMELILSMYEVFSEAFPTMTEFILYDFSWLPLDFLRLIGLVAAIQVIGFFSVISLTKTFYEEE